MQHPQEPQRVYPDPSMYPPGTVPPNPYYVAPPPVQAPPGRFTTVRRGTRLVLRRSMYGMARLGHVARPYALFLVIIALMGIVMSWMGLQLLSGTMIPPVAAGTPQVGPSSEVESFIKGHQSFNADEMWSAYSSDYQADQIQKGFTKETLQTVMNNERTKGFKLGSYEYVGGVPTGNGAMHFYTIDLSLPDRQMKVPMIFTVDTNGKITETEGQLLQIITPHSQNGN